MTSRPTADVRDVGTDPAALRRVRELEESIAVQLDAARRSKERVRQAEEGARELRDTVAAETETRVAELHEQVAESAAAEVYRLECEAQERRHLLAAAARKDRVDAVALVLDAVLPTEVHR